MSSPAQMAKNLPVEAYERLRSAVETDKWPDGQRLSPSQREHAMQLVLAYQALVLKSTEYMTVGPDGAIVHKSKAQLKRQFQHSQEIFRTRQ